MSDIAANLAFLAIGGFFSSLFSGLFGTREMRILILGLDGAGKTTILYRLQVGEVVTTIPSQYLFRKTYLNLDVNLLKLCLLHDVGT